MENESCEECDGTGRVEMRGCGHYGCCPCDDRMVLCEDCDGTGLASYAEATS